MIHSKVTSSQCAHAKFTQLLYRVKMNVRNIHKSSLFLFKSFMTEDVQGLVNKLAWFIYPIYQFEFKKNCFAWITSPVSGIFKNIYSWIKLSRTFFFSVDSQLTLTSSSLSFCFTKVFSNIGCIIKPRTTNHRPTCRSSTEPPNISQPTHRPPTYRQALHRSTVLQPCYLESNQ